MVLPPKGGGCYHRIRLVELIWKLTASIIINNFKGEINLYVSLNIFHESGGGEEGCCG